MKEYPVLFSGEMVRAILRDEAPKTQTRRPLRASHFPQSIHDEAFNIGVRAAIDANPDGVRFPYGAGDRLWVRETFDSRNSAGERWKPSDAAFVVFRDGAQMYRDGTYAPPLDHYSPGAFDSCKWRPNIHMPRWASRLLLDVVSVRFERLRDISDDDARAEGCSGTDPEPIAEGGTIYAMKGQSSAPSPRAHFWHLWDSLYGGSEFSWRTNPWVAAVTFQRVKGIGP